MKPLTVVQILPALESGGVERGTLEVAEALVKQGHRAIVISSGGKLVDDLVKMGAEHICLPIEKKSLWTLLQIWPLRKQLKGLNTDVLHLRSRLPGWIAYLAWRGMPVKSRPRLITTVHGLHSVNRYSKIVGCGERIIAVSQTSKQYVLDNYPSVPPEKIKVIYRGIDPEKFKWNYKAQDGWVKVWQKQYPQFIGKKILTLPGRLTRLKGHEDFIELIDELQQRGENVHGVIVGGAHVSKQKYLNELKNIIENRELSSHITFTGQRGDIIDIYSVSDLIFSLSRKPESFGRTVLEPLAMGIPVIGWNYGGVGEILDRLFPQGKVHKDDKEELITVTMQLLAKPEEPKSENPFTLDRMLSETLSLYQELVESKTKKV